ncbi:MAG: PilZ domain-containing protein [Geobacter sp.]|nr:PilZ domain-containing protein [Geobacter sp.]
MEKRNFSRIPFNVGSVIKWTDKSYKGEVENLSLQGMFVKLAETIPQDEEVDVTIYLTGVTPQIPVNLKGVVIRSGADGAALKFIKMSTDSFIHLRNIMAHNTGDSGKVMDELFNFIKSHQSKQDEP